jgi:biopolymer transport protein ExbB
MFGEMSFIDVIIASPTMLVLLVCSIITVGYAVERALYFKTAWLDTGRFMGELANRMKSGNPRGALDYCTQSKGPVARVMAQAVRYLNRPREELVQRIDTAIELEQVEMERNLSILGTMSNIAPLLGLFGTVIGIIRAFADIARTGSGGGAVVAMGVSEALLTTAAGIVVAVIATVFYNFFVRQIRTRTAKLEDAREEYFAIWSQIQQRPRVAANATQKAAQKAPPRTPAARKQPAEAVLT